MRSYLVVAGLMLLVVTIPAYAQSQTVTVTVNQQSFAQGESIVVSGTVSAALIEHPIILQVFSANDNWLDAGQSTVAQDGTFAYIFNTGGDRWSTPGRYSVVAHYSDSTAEVEFSITEARLPTNGDDPVRADCTQTVDGGDLGEVEVRCSISGGTVNSMRMAVEDLSIVLRISSETDGNISLNLPVALIDAKDMNGSNENFIVRIDDVQVPHEETGTSTISRTVDFDFIRGETIIEIIGTRAVPEFGTVALIVFALGFAAVAAMKRPGLFGTSGFR